MRTFISPDGILVGTIFAAVGSLINRLVGGFDITLEALCTLMIIDYFSGWLSAYIRPDGQISSARGLKGAAKKILILFLIVMSEYLSLLSGVTMIRDAVCWFFIGNEGLSILENAAKAGVPIPQKLRDSLETLKKKGD